MEKQKLAFIGAGRVGSTLALGLSRRGYQIMVVVDSNRQLAADTAAAVGAEKSTATMTAAISEADFIIVAVPDQQILTVAKQLGSRGCLKAGQVCCHTSGFLPASALASVKLCGAHTVSLHPMASIAVRLTPWERLNDLYFAVEGDPRGLNQARRLANDLGARCVAIAAKQKPLYHAACVMASNYPVALLELAKIVFRHLDLSEEVARGMVLSLAGSVWGNLGQNDLRAALTGPIVRGDTEIVAGHIKALAQADSVTQEVYSALGRAVVAIARGKGLPPASAERLELALGKK